MSVNNEPTSTDRSTAYQAKLAVHARDRYTCIGCREGFDDPSKLDVDHIISRGQGGSNAIRNKATECRRCHEAKHEERDHAPTIRCVSTGDMINKDFVWFEHFWKRQLPALFKLALDYRVKPNCGLAESKSYTAWHIPLGDIRRLDEVLADMDDLKYVPMGVVHYM